jgi:hypothetical protein
MEQERISGESTPGLTPAWAAGHDVQFYETEDFLAASVARFLAEGIRAGQPLVVIATESHRLAFIERLKTMQIDASDTSRVDVAWLDARETLAAFMERGMPDPEMFEATVGNVLKRVVAQRSYIVVRAYGEMVDLLWKDGNIDGALALEELWNGLAARYSFNLLCAYSMNSFFKHSHAKGFSAVCGHHQRVFPPEQGTPTIGLSA